MDEILEELVPVMKKEFPRRAQTNENLYSYYNSRVRRHLHVVLCFSPVGSLLICWLIMRGLPWPLWHCRWFFPCYNSILPILRYCGYLSIYSIHFSPAVKFDRQYNEKVCIWNPLELLTAVLFCKMAKWCPIFQILMLIWKTCTVVSLPCKCNVKPCTHWRL